MNIFSDIVKSRKDGTPGIDTTNILNELLADDAWLEQVIVLNCLNCCKLDNQDDQFHRKDLMKTKDVKTLI